MIKDTPTEFGYTKSYSQKLAIFSIVTEGTVGDMLEL